MPRVKNCWEFMKCGYGLYGRKAKTAGPCRAACEKRLDGVHRGKNGGRTCWFVDNTSDSGQGARGEFSSKFPVCMNCRFYWKVRKEEEYNFEISLF